MSINDLLLMFNQTITMLFLDFEKPIEELYEQLAELKKTADLNDDVAALNAAVAALEKKITTTRKNIYNK